MTISVGDEIEFRYQDKMIKRKVTMIAEDGTMYVDLDSEGGVTWAVHPSNARRLFGSDPGPPAESNPDPVENNPPGRRRPQDPLEEPQIEARKLVDLDTYAKVATVVIFGGLILGHM